MGLACISTPMLAARSLIHAPLSAVINMAGRSG
jgi:hypothetical protein